MPEYNITELVEELKSDNETNIKIQAFLENVKQFDMKLGEDRDEKNYENNEIYRKSTTN